MAPSNIDGSRAPDLGGHSRCATAVKETSDRLDATIRSLRDGGRARLVLVEVSSTLASLVGDVCGRQCHLVRDASDEVVVCDTSDRCVEVRSYVEGPARIRSLRLEISSSCLSNSVPG